MKKKMVPVEELAKYADQYIALSLDRTKILASGKTIEEVDKKLKKAKVKTAILHYIPPLNVSLSLLCRS